jgi:phosphoribosylanthranilate isomerase
MEIKICGLTNADDATAAIEAGADFVGFVLYAGSPRAVAPAVLPRILDRLPAPFRAVAVVVNLPQPDLARLTADCPLHAVQFHGDESPGAADGCARRVWRAVSAGESGWAPDPALWPHAERFVVDAAAPGRYGGTGKRADWDAARALAAGRTVMLAGGLTPENVAEAIRAVRPFGVDVVSGVESRPGRKDAAAVRRFIAAARGAEERREQA